MMELEKTYDHSKVEDKIYKMWMKSGYFNPDKLPNAEKREPFIIALPPPNVTGALHMGHAFEDTIQDIVIRFQRMQGKRALWLPGTDHAAIATQAKFEKEHYKQAKKSRHDYSRGEFFEMINKFALQNQSSILSQLHKMGLSLDWSRLAFTLDEQRGLAVKTAFKQMYDAGLIYRSYRVVNWDVKGQTTVSDDEIEYEETKGKLYTFKYSKDFPIAIATTRPETKVGDAAVAVHPDDERYKKYVGQEFDVNFCGVDLHIKIVADKEIDPAYGTGAVGVTPLHSMVDFEIAQRHNLKGKQVINEFGKMTVGGKKLEGKKTAEARELIAQWLRDQYLMEKEEDITQNLSRAQRTGGVIEPLPKLQWFVDVNKKFKMTHSKLKGVKTGKEITLKDVMRQAVQSGQIKIMPEHFAKTYFHWIDNLRDWCISRQIVYGHQIPVWYKNNLSLPPSLKLRRTSNPSPQKERETAESLSPPEGREGERLQKIYCGINPPKGKDWEQDPDTLDTWFSSGLWTFSTLGWPDDTADLKTYHPTSVMMPGYEILFFWVARMILMSGFLLGNIPFHKVYLHGIVRDSKGQKFSKSLNNGIDPLEIAAKYGTDALRMALVFGAAPGNDVIFDEQKVKGMKHFANKLWNIARYILSNIDEPSIRRHSEGAHPTEESQNKKEILHSVQDDALTEADKDILAKLNAAIKSVTDNLENFFLHEAAQSIYQFVWHEFADVYIEASKKQLQDEKFKENTYNLLLYNLQTILKLLHPFMPFVTEEIWGKLGQKNLLIIEQWPK